jgi:hypothetical protein
MSALEQDLFDKIRKLDEQSKLRVLEFVNDLGRLKRSFEERQAEAEAIYQELRARYGDNHFPSSADILNEIREERLSH